MWRPSRAAGDAASSASVDHIASGSTGLSASIDNQSSGRRHETGGVASADHVESGPSGLFAVGGGVDDAARPQRAGIRPESATGGSDHLAMAPGGIVAASDDFVWGGSGGGGRDPLGQSSGERGGGARGAGAEGFSGGQSHLAQTASGISTKADAQVLYGPLPAGPRSGLQPTVGGGARGAGAAGASGGADHLGSSAAGIMPRER